MQQRFLRFIFKSFFTLVFSWMLLASAGWPQLVYAVSCSDVVDQASGTKYSDALTSFFYFGSKTYAVARPDNNFFQWDANITREYLLDGVDVNSLKKQIQAGKYGAAKPLLVSSAAIKDFIMDKYGDALKTGNTYINAWQEYNGAEFTTMEGAALSYTNWASPPSQLTPAAVTMGQAGTMTPVTSGKAVAQIVEFDGKLDCSFDMNPQPTVPTDPGTGTDSGLVGGSDPNAVKDLICSQDLNNNGFVGEVGELGACLNTPQGQLCTVGALDCNTSYQAPTCPAGSVMNYDRDMCQADHISVQCPSGYTWDASIDRCVSNPLACPDGGVLDITLDFCTKLATDTCPTGYTNAGSGLCTKPVVCSDGGTYNPLNDRCEVGKQAAGCAAGLTYNAGANRCEAAPTCAAGFTYSNTYNKCLKAVSVCANGYSWNTTRQRCEKAPPECVAGTSYNLTTNKCEANPTCSSGTYNATANACTSSYAATLSGGMTSHALSVYAGFGGIWVPGYVSRNYFTGSVRCDNICADSSAMGRSVSCQNLPPPLYCSTSVKAAAVNYIVGSDEYGNYIYGTYYYPQAPDPTGGTYTCPSGGTLSGSTCNTSVVATCPFSTSLDGASDKCVANPTCTGGTVDTTNDVCYYAATACNTAAGEVYDAAAGQCSLPATCAGGNLDTTLDLCIASLPAATCPTGYTEDATLGICYISSICAPGAYVSANGRCEAAVTKDCGTYTYDSVIGKCSKAPTCPTDAAYWLNNTIAYSPGFDKCMAQATHTCPSNTTWNTVPIGKCEAAPICDGAVYYDPAADQCVVSANCPYGNQYICMANPLVGGKLQCSPNPCVNTSSSGGEPNIAEPMEQSYFQDDGEKDAAGNCLGTVYIFSGKPGRCRPPGWTVGMINNCCDKGDVMPENTGSSLGLMSSMYDMAKMASAMYQAAQGWTMYTNAVNNLGQTPSQAMDLVLNNLSSSVNNGAMTASQAATQVSGAQAAQAGASQASAMSDAAINAGKGLAAAAIVYAVGAIVKALGGDQDAVMVGSVATTAMLAMCTTLLTGPQAIVGIIVIVVMRVLMGSGCEPTDITTAGQVKSKRCHFVGDYCEKKWALVGCVQQAKGYCCFNSMLARIINEQGRPQLSVFGPSGGWGEPNKPECRGFTPDEFQALDFSRIDLSEYFSVVQKDMDAKIQASQQNIVNSVQKKFQDMQGLPSN